jgi:hypothetical protein
MKELYINQKPKYIHLFVSDAEFQKHLVKGYENIFIQIGKEKNREKNKVSQSGGDPQLRQGLSITKVNNRLTMLHFRKCQLIIKHSF